MSKMPPSFSGGLFWAGLSWAKAELAASASTEATTPAKIRFIKISLNLPLFAHRGFHSNCRRSCRMRIVAASLRPGTDADFSAKWNALIVRARCDVDFTQAVSVLARACREHCTLRRAGRRALGRSGAGGGLLVRTAGRRTRCRRDRCARLSPRGWPRGPSRRHRTGVIGDDGQGYGQEYG